MNQQERRLTLAKLMGYEFVPATGSYAGPNLGTLPATPSFWKCPGKADIYGPYPENDPPFHPYKNANHDVEVLTWMRDLVDDTDLLDPHFDAAGLMTIVDYEVGMYADAAISGLSMPRQIVAEIELLMGKDGSEA